MHRFSLSDISGMGTYMREDEQRDSDEFGRKKGDFVDRESNIRLKL